MSLCRSGKKPLQVTEADSGFFKDAFIYISFEITLWVFISAFFALVINVVIAIIGMLCLLCFIYFKNNGESYFCQHCQRIFDEEAVSNTQRKFD